MGFMDAINPEDRIEITKSEYHALLKNTAQLELMVRLIKNDTPIKTIKTAFNVKEEKEA